MPRKKEPENVEWVVSGRLTLSGATCIVHAPDRKEAIRRANAGQHIGEVEWGGAEIADWDFRIAEANVGYDD